MNSPLRVAFLTDTYHEVNGVALTSRQFAAFAGRSDLPFLCVYGGPETKREQRGSVTYMQLKRGPLSFSLDKGLHHDVALWRFRNLLARELRAFRPDIIHVTSPGDVGQLGALLAHQLHMPLVLSWHTNFHEFGAQRLSRRIQWMPALWRARIAAISERLILSVVLRFYKLGRVLFAPNRELVDMLRRSTGKPAFLMERGIDTALYSPAKRTLFDGVFRLGYVGRVTPEKSVRLLVAIERELLAAGKTGFRFLVAGDGSEREWLRSNLKNADLPGVLRGEDLARAYANMDVFVFPSRTDTFGNVVLEALASGAPAVVTNGGGPKFIVRHGVSGFVAESEAEFIAYVRELMDAPDLRRRMSQAARAQAGEASWDRVFEKVYDGYASIA